LQDSFVNGWQHHGLLKDRPWTVIAGGLVASLRLGRGHREDAARKHVTELSSIEDLCQLAIVSSTWQGPSPGAFEFLTSQQPIAVAGAAGSGTLEQPLDDRVNRFN
jgi:hypothetical protein